MVTKQDICDTNSIPDSDSDTSTIATCLTPPSTIFPSSSSTNHDNHDNDINHSHSGSVPWPDSTFLIRASSSGKLLTLNSGNVILARPGDRQGSFRWKCIERRGWLYFQNTASGCYLGHNIHGNIICSVTHHDGWERFTARLRPEGGYYLMMTHWDRLWKVGFKGGNLAKIAEGEEGGFVNTGEREGEVIVWEFVKI
ncbi:major facilitator superfamily transporter multidrug resistance protein [Rutstroemia sp. NJR-2017a BVV2]|nr:major facilitator superfamily transporter multidrug resistance protein [Rutstroemia sp. NJR-2017a BVV2]